MKTTIATIQGAEIVLETDISGNEVVTFTADMDVDCDGSGGNPHHDPFFQPDTSLHLPARPNPAGKALHAELVPYIVVPPIVLHRTLGKVLGSLCEVTNLKNSKTCMAVVGDVGPRSKVGEGSPALCEALGLSGNPNSGGTDSFTIRYRIMVGTPAVIDGVTYELQGASA